MGYLKSGSMKSLAAGGLSALLLGFIYTELPTRPAFASSLGFGKICSIQYYNSYMNLNFWFGRHAAAC